MIVQEMFSNLMTAVGRSGFQGLMRATHKRRISEITMVVSVWRPAMGHIADAKLAEVQPGISGLQTSRCRREH